MSNLFLNKGEKQLLKVRSDHEWRKQKRQELNAVIKAVDKYLLGSAFTPASAMPLVYLCREMREKLTVKNWGR
jgi:hypothetical protein